MRSLSYQSSRCCYCLLLYLFCCLPPLFDSKRLGEGSVERYENVTDIMEEKRQQRRLFFFQNYQHSKLLVPSSFTAESQQKNDSDAVILPNQYWVRLNENVKDVSSKVETLLEIAECGQVLWTYKIITQAFTINVEDCLYREQIDQILDDVGVVRAVPIPVVTGNSIVTQNASALWWLDRMDQKVGSDSQYRYSYDGTGVQIYVFDSGIRFTHTEFNGRASCGFNARAYTGERCSDNNGHGTFNAGVAAGTTYGIAKNATVLAVRALDRNLQGTLADLMSGFEYVAEQKENNPEQPMVVSVSISTTMIDTDCFDFYLFDGCFKDGRNQLQDYDEALTKLSDMGVVIVNSAGNSYRNACRYFPGSNKKTITVGATNKLNVKTSFSNWGRCVDIFAPGFDITSSWARGDTSTYLASGTSISAPMVAGVAALYLQRNPNMTADEVRQQIIRDASRFMFRYGGPFTPRRIVTTVGLLEENV